MPEILVIDMYKNADGKLKYVSSRDELLVKKGLEGVRVNQLVKMTLDLTPDNQRRTQINKVHAIIGEIAKETGHEFDQIKDEIKKRAGLINEDEEPISFKNCSMEDLSAATRSAISLAEFLGMTVKT